MSSSNSNSALFEKLTENMQVIYRKAIDADASLAKIQQSGQGKFNHVFSDEAGFEVQSKRFMPYVEELAKDIANLQSADMAKLEEELPSIVKKMELLLATLAQFKSTI